jgi:hypothetical protein
MMPRLLARGTEWAVRLYLIRPRIIRLDAAYWSLRLITWIHATLHATAVIPWNRHSAEEPFLLASHLEACEELGKRSAIERFGWLASFCSFTRPCPPLCGWSAIERQVALTYAASIIVGLTAQHAGRPDLIRSPKRVLAHCWEAL